MGWRDRAVPSTWSLCGRSVDGRSDPSHAYLNLIVPGPSPDQVASP